MSHEFLAAAVGCGARSTDAQRYKVQCKHLTCNYSRTGTKSRYKPAVVVPSIPKVVVRYSNISTTRLSGWPLDRLAIAEMLRKEKKVTSHVSLRFN